MESERKRKREITPVNCHFSWLPEKFLSSSLDQSHMMQEAGQTEFFQVCKKPPLFVRKQEKNKKQEKPSLCSYILSLASDRSATSDVDGSAFFSTIVFSRFWSCPLADYSREFSLFVHYFGRLFPSAATAMGAILRNCSRIETILSFICIF